MASFQVSTHLGSSHLDLPTAWQECERGLRRAYHGDRFGTPQDHALWLSLADDSGNQSHGELGQGYRCRH